MSETPETAMFEANARARRFNLQLKMPKVTVGFEFNASAILDMTDPAVLSTLPADLHTTCMTEDWDAENSSGAESVSQAFGRAALTAGFDSLRVPSHPHPEGVNVVAFLSPNARTRVALLNPELLRRLGRN